MRVEIKLPDREIFSVKDLARALDVHLSSAWRYILHGSRGYKLPSFFVGSKRRVRRVDILAWIEAINADRHDDDQESRRDRSARQDGEAVRVEKLLDAEGL